MLTTSGGGRIRLAKASADESVTEGDGDYGLEGAVYGVYKGDELVARITTGEDGHGSTGARVPDGTYTVREIEAPAGYVLSDEEYEVTISGHDAVVDAEDTPVTVTFRLKKTDAETGEAAPQGASSLDGAVYEASFERNGKNKTVRGTTQNGEVTFEGIPLGRISVREVTPPTGYLPDTEEHVFDVTAENAGHGSAVFELAPEGEFTEQVVRGDLALVKVADGTQQRLAGVPFKITSKTTGESHVIVTDGNGQASTAASWNAHTKDTHGGAADSGVWFGGFEPDDAKGALSYDDYTVEGLPCEANADRALIPAFDVSVYRDSVTVDLGTLTNDAPPSETPPAPGVRTEATGADDGGHEAVADDSVTIVDTVSYTGLTPSKEYTLTGTLVDKETGEPVCSDGKAVISTVAFVPDAADGMQEVTFTFDGAELSGHAVVAFESLTLEGQEVAVHADVNDEGQTVELVPPETPTPGGKLPQTGDELPIAGICALAAAGCAASVIGIARSIGTNRREEDEGEEA
ncbi:VaFE repeat-containing surface-anchored protein [Olsenella uli]